MTHTGPTLSASTRALGGWRARLLRPGTADVAAACVLLACGAVGYGAVFGSWRGYAAAFGGLLVAAVVQQAGAARGWSVFTRASLLVVAYLALGGPLVLPSTTIAGVVPTLETIQRLVLLTWQGWRDLLTVSLPAGEFEGPAAVPLVAALALTPLALALAASVRWRWAALVPAGLFLLGGILWGGPAAPFALAQGAVFAVASVLWLSMRPTEGSEAVAHVRFGPQAVPPSSRHRWLPVAGVLAAAVALGGLAYPAVAGPDRYLLRDQVEPPLDLEQYASPLTMFRGLESRLPDEPLMRVTGLPEGGRVRLAAMDLYDGNVYNVSETSALFRRSGETVLPTGFSLPDRPATTLGIDIEGYEGVWLPGGGDLRGVRFDGDRGEDQADGLHVNAATGTALTTAGVAPGTSYEVDVVLPPARPEELPDDLTAAAVTLPPVTGRFEELGSVAAQMTEEADTTAEVVTALEEKLQQGFFADGDPDPSLPGHTTERERLLLANPSGQIVGDDEQYAVAMALLARESGLPARVVMGFYPENWRPGPLTIVGDDVHAWTEVAFEGLGWVAFDPTPSEDRVPDDQVPTPQTRKDPQVLPPPEVPDPLRDKVPTKAQADQQDEEDEDEPGIAWLVLAAALVGGVGSLALLTAPLWLALLLKSRRRRRREHASRPADRASGAWSEVADVAVDLGRPLPAYATRRELVPTLAPAEGDPSRLYRYADRVDATVFGAAEPTEAEATALWGESREVRRELLDGLGWRDRQRARFSWRSVLRPSTPPKQPTQPKQPRP